MFELAHMIARVDITQKKPLAWACNADDEEVAWT